MNVKRQPSDIPDRELHAGSADALTQFYRQQVRSLWQWVYRRVGGDRHVADDLVSGVFLTMVESLEQFDPSRGSAEAWLYGIARRQLADYLRQTYRQQHHLPQLGRHMTRDGEIADAGLTMMLADESHASVQQTLNQLPPTYRDVLIWAYVERLSGERIAQRLARSPKAAENLLYRARQRFRQLHDQPESRPASIAGTDSPAQRCMKS